MGLFGNKKDEPKEPLRMADEDLDAKILAAIEETDEEEKQRKDEEKAAEAQRVQEISKARAENSGIPDGAVPMQGRLGKRCFFVVEKTEEGEDSIALSGNVHGEFAVGDKVFLNRPDDSTSLVEIKAILGSDGKSREKASNESVVVFVSFDDENVNTADPLKAAPRYSVISNIQPQKEIDPKRPVENPYLLGLTLEHARFLGDRDFMKHFARQIILGKFILPVQADLTNTPDGKKRLQLITVSDKSDPSAKYLAVFTDLSAIAGVKGIFPDDTKPSVTVMTFPAVAKALGGGAQGIVINPFGPSKVKVSKEFVENVMGSVSVAGGSKSKVTSLPKAGPDARKLPGVLVGKPPKTEETENIRTALVKYAAGVPEIASASLLLKADKTSRGYLVVVDCPQTMQKKIFDGIRSAVSPYLKDIKTCESILYAKAPFAEGYFKQNEPDYTKA